jgi:arsenate reductase
MKKPKVLFICVHNSARSQMAAAFLKEICPNEFEAHSAGLEAGSINPLAIQAMAEVGIDISENKTQMVFDAWRAGTMYTHVIRVCSEAEAEARACPIFPSPVTRLSWPFEDPTSFQGSRGAKLEQMRSVRDAIEKKIREWCGQVCSQKGFLQQEGKTTEL